MTAGATNESVRFLADENFNRQSSKVSGANSRGWTF